jgi:hypothetical protein
VSSAKFQRKLQQDGILDSQNLPVDQEYRLILVNPDAGCYLILTFEDNSPLTGFKFKLKRLIYRNDKRAYNLILIPVKPHSCIDVECVGA